MDTEQVPLSGFCIYAELNTSKTVLFVSKCNQYASHSPPRRRDSPVLHPDSPERTAKSTWSNKHALTLKVLFRINEKTAQIVFRVLLVVRTPKVQPNLKENRSRNSHT